MHSTSFWQLSKVLTFLLSFLPETVMYKLLVSNSNQVLVKGLWYSSLRSLCKLSWFVFAAAVSQDCSPLLPALSWGLLPISTTLLCFGGATSQPWGSKAQGSKAGGVWFLCLDEVRAWGASSVRCPPFLASVLFFFSTRLAPCSARRPDSSLASSWAGRILWASSQSAVKGSNFSRIPLSLFHL